MHDPRLDKLADVLTTHSTKIQPGEFVLIEGIDIPQEMVIALIRSVRKAGGIPLVELKQNRIQREIILNGDDAGIKLMGEYEIYRVSNPLLKQGACAKRMPTVHSTSYTADYSKISRLW